jgi:hypothetical protein
MVPRQVSTGATLLMVPVPPDMVSAVPSTQISNPDSAVVVMRTSTMCQPAATVSAEFW